MKKVIKYTCPECGEEDGIVARQQQPELLYPILGTDESGKKLEQDEPEEVDYDVTTLQDPVRDYECEACGEVVYRGSEEGFIKRAIEEGWLVDEDEEEEDTD